MPYLYLFLSAVFMASSSVFGGYYSRRTMQRKDATPLFNLVRMLATLICWCVIYAFDFSFDAGVLLYSLGFGGCFALATIALIYAIKYGSVALTSLMLQVSLIGVCIWGLIFWGAPFTILVLLGLILVTIGIALCVLEGKKEEGKKTISLRWLFFSLLAFAGNAGCSIIQKEQQLFYGGKHGSMLMVFGLIIAFLVCLVLYLKSDKTDTRLLLKTEWGFPVFAGVSNTALNLFVILLATSTLSSSLIYPVIAVGGLLVTTLFSLFAFKEKLKWWQWVGFVIGTVGIVLLNI